MVMAINELLTRIHSEQEDVGEYVPAPADAVALKDLQTYIRQELGTDLPNYYEAFLARANGLDFNGTVIYAAGQPRNTDGTRILAFPELNAIFREAEDRTYVLYGETGDELFAQHLSDMKWYILDRGSLYHLEEFSSFDGLLERVLNT